jgi:hypothetical protein
MEPHEALRVPSPADFARIARETTDPVFQGS